MEYESFITRYDELDQETQIPIIVEYTYHGDFIGKRDSVGGVKNAGPPLEDERVEIEIISIKNAETNNTIELDFFEEEEILKRIQNEIDEN